jgi:hypothetical protein
MQPRTRRLLHNPANGPLFPQHCFTSSPTAHRDMVICILHVSPGEEASNISYTQPPAPLPQPASTCNATPARKAAAGKPTGKDARQRHAHRKPPSPLLSLLCCSAHSSHVSQGYPAGRQPSPYAVQQRQPPPRPATPSHSMETPAAPACVCVSARARRKGAGGDGEKERDKTNRDETKQRDVSRTHILAVLKSWRKKLFSSGSHTHLDHLDLCCILSIFSILSSRYP